MYIWNEDSEYYFRLRRGIYFLQDILAVGSFA